MVPTRDELHRRHRETTTAHCGRTVTPQHTTGTETGSIHRYTASSFTGQGTSTPSEAFPRASHFHSRNTYDKKSQQQQQQQRRAGAGAEAGAGATHPARALQGHQSHLICNCGELIIELPHARLRYPIQHERQQQQFLPEDIQRHPTLLQEHGWDSMPFKQQQRQTNQLSKAAMSNRKASPIAAMP